VVHVKNVGMTTLSCGIWADVKFVTNFCFMQNNGE